MKKTLIDPSFLNLLAGLWGRLTVRRRRQFILLLGLMLVSAVAEVVSLGAVLPFLGILVAPDHVLSLPIVKNVAMAWGVTSADQLVLPLTVGFAAAALIAGAIRILLLWASTRLAFTSGADIGVEIYRRTLYQPYSVHVARNSSEVISGITIKVGSAVGTLDQLLKLISSTILLVAIMIALLSINAMVATVAAVGFGTSYVLITVMFRRRLNKNGLRIASEQTQVIKALQEGLGGIRDVLLDGTQPVYYDIFEKSVRPLRQAQSNVIFLAGSPRYIMEAMGMVLIAALAFVLSYQAGGISAAIPTLGALAIGAQRLLPALQQIYSAWASIAGNYASLVDTIELLDQPFPMEIMQPVSAPLPFQRDICLDAMRFRYTDDGPWVVDGLNLRIPKGSRVGFVGSTGSGKSTTLDLLMGLIKPSEGELLVDDQPISGHRVGAWQRSIAHVPQSIYLSDTSLAENIAFGLPPNAIDMCRVRQAARQAQIADFIESRPGGYGTYIGELGVQLSGGQRQRIGIARALYKQASVLVFDEATSALDNTTEQSVMDAIEGLNPELTILLIAHRLSTVKRCDIIVELERGRVVAQGTYDQLLECSPSFRRMEKLI